MNRPRSSAVLGAVLSLVAARAAAAPAPADVPPLTPQQLRCERRPDPLGVDVPRPRLNWTLSAGPRGAAPSAYQVLVATSAAALARDQGDAWDSGQVRSDDALAAAYAGAPLRSSTQYFWKVRAWDEAGRASAWSGPATWTTGLLAADDWRGARWIAAAPDDAAAATQPAVRPLPIFRRSFAVDRPVRRALVYVCGLGQFELRINGEKVGADVMEPGWTDYRKTCLYVTYDVTSQVKAGENVAGVMLGNGMYNLPPLKGRYQKFRGSFGPPALIAQLRVEYADGSTATIVTDKDWKSTDGPVRYSAVYGGEDYDARRWPDGWDRAGFDDAAWTPAAEVAGPGGTLAALGRSAPPVRVAQTFEPKGVTRPRPGVFVYDFGQNAALVPQVTVEGPAGASVKLTPGELLGRDGAVSQSASGGPSWFAYTLAGTGPQTWSPRFTYYGSRYLQVEGAVPAGEANPASLPVIRAVSARFITSDSPAAGEFACSDDLFNRTATLIRWAMRSNMVSLLTDCPHRERLGWLEQDHLVGPSLMYEFDAESLMDKVCWDIADAQTPDGLVPDIAPEYTKFGGGFRDSPEWGSAAVLIPWQLYQFYGDEQVLRDHYDTMRRYVDYLGTRAKDHVLSYGLGDWYDLGPKRPGVAQLTPVSLTATAFYYRDAALLAQIARLTGKPDDADRYAALADQIKTAFNASLYHPDRHSYATGSQASNAIPLVFGLVPDADREAVLASLVADVRSHDNGLTAGDIGYRYVLRALAEAGRSDVIFDMNSRSDRPGYGYILNKGATSLTEGWDGSASQDHFMLGHIMEWFYRDLAGIGQDPAGVGFRKIVISPTPVGDVTSASATYRSIRGPISSRWKIDGKTFTLDVSIPPGSTAVVRVPADRADQVTESGRPVTGAGDVRVGETTNGRVACEIGSGDYHFVVSR